jgi:trk system potassium uptake protein TrkH
MNNNSVVFFKKVSAGVGSLLFIPGIMAILSLPVTIYFKEAEGTYGFLVTAGACFGLGSFLLFAGRQEIKNYKGFNLLEVMCIASLGWPLVALGGSIPFYYISNAATPLVPDAALTDYGTFLNCFFESTSGITSTGLTMSNAPSELPHALQWWRSFLQWIGGVGLIIFISLLLGPETTAVKKYYEDKKVSKALPSIGFNVGDVGLIYSVFTVIAILSLYLQGIPFWEALNHGLTSISTGGFTITDDSLRSYPGNLQLTIFFITLIGALNFNLYNRTLRNKNTGLFFKDSQVLTFLGLLMAGIFFLHQDNLSYIGDIPFIDSLFQLGSALATAGFQTSDIDKWSPMALLLLTIFMMLGGNSSSTTSGIKTFRLIGLLKGSFYFTASLFLGKGKKLSFTINGKEYSDEESLNIFSHITVFITIFLLSFSIIFVLLYYFLPENYTFSQKLFESSSAFNNVGLSTGITGPDLSDRAKIIMIIGMIIGRIELIPLYVLAFISFKKLR